MRLSARLLVGLTLVGFGALALNSCGGGGSSPSGPVQPTAPPVATPTPVPTPESGLSASCAKLPVGTVTASCKTDEPDFQADVDEAIRTLQREQPQIFHADEVLSSGAFYVGLIKILDRKGLCAATDGEELGVARTSSYNEQYDVLSSRGGARFGPVSYRTTCSPSVVPIPTPGLPPQQAGCPLPPSREIACGREPASKYYVEVESAISQILKEKPELFDFTDINAGSDNPAIRDIAGYNKGMVELMVGRGFCATHDGEELVVKRGSNERSEHFDVDLAGGKYVRRGEGIYRVSCYPAAF
jgi:hypothetical protein